MVLSVLIARYSADAQAPEHVSVQGQLLDASGKPITGYHTMRVRLYDTGTGAVLYDVTDSGTTSDGLFNFHLGPMDEVVFGAPMQIGISIDGQAELPRSDVESVPFALGLRGLRVQWTKGYALPNLIGGHAANAVKAGVYGATIGGGGALADDPNRIESHLGTIAGGRGNVISAASPIDAMGSVIGGGSWNTVSAWSGLVAGGSNNAVTANLGVVGGGHDNVAGGHSSTVPGGSFNKANGYGSFAAGSHANAAHDGSFVWQDHTPSIPSHELSTYKANMFRARASGGFYFQTAPAPNLSIGASLPSNEGTWSALSSRKAKKDFLPVDVFEVLDKVGGLEISTWRYETQDEPVRHLGPMAEDFYAAFALGIDEEHISELDTGGVALAAIQALYRIVMEQRTEIDRLRRELNASQEE